MQRLRSIVVACALATLAVAQNASYTFFGSDCQNSTWPPTPFTNLSLPRLGQTLTIQTNSSWRSFSSGADVFLITGTSRTHWNGLNLPFDTAGSSGNGALFCGNLYVSAELLLLVPGVAGNPVPVQLNVSIPNSPALLGAVFYQQVLENRTILNEVDYFFTRAGEARIGN